MNKHPNCQERCQYAEHKGYQPCEGFCDAARAEEAPCAHGVPLNGPRCMECFPEESDVIV